MNGMKTRRVTGRWVRPGDFADHRSRTLDPRPVARVLPGGMITLQIGSIETEPIPSRNYTFTRREEDQ